IIGRPREHRLQLSEPLIGGVLATKSGHPFELDDRLIESAVLVMRRAELAQTRMRLAGELLDQGLYEARLADAGLAGNQYDAARHRLGLLPAATQKRQLLVAADERRADRAQCLEAALGRALAQYPRGRDRRRQTPDLDRSQILVVEQSAGQPPRARGDHH